jgi:hypothetical protein
MHQLPVDIDDQGAVSFIEFLKHLFSRGLRE